MTAPAGVGLWGISAGLGWRGCGGDNRAYNRRNFGAWVFRELLIRRCREGYYD